MRNEDIFVGRKTELSELRSLVSKNTASLVIVKGRRRVGKSRLIQEFVKKRKCISLRGIAPNAKTTAQGERDEFSRQLSEATGLPQLKSNDWADLFKLLAREVATGRVFVIFDEISWMGSKDPMFLGKLKDAWEQYFKLNKKLMLILCGSISTWIDQEIINSTAFYGRISWAIFLKELPLTDANKMLDAAGFKCSFLEKFKILSITGGIPWYIEQMQPNFSAEENIKRHCFTTNGILLEEYDRIFKEIFGKRSDIYKKLIHTIVNSSLTYHQITEQTHYKSSGRLSQYLDELVQADFIAKDYAWIFKTGKKSKNLKYRLIDNYLRFYLKYIEPKRDLIERNRFKFTTLNSLPGWDTIMGLQFENLVVNNRHLILSALNIKEKTITYDNPYMQKETKHQKACQIDYLIQTKQNNLFVCEIKFSKKPVTSKVITQVKEKVTRLHMPSNFAILPVLIHVSGVNEKVKNSDYFYEIIDFQTLCLH